MQQQDNQLIIKMKRVIQSHTYVQMPPVPPGLLCFYDPLFSNADFNIVTKHIEIYYGAANSRDLNVD